jgi:hypothetical protein
MGDDWKRLWGAYTWSNVDFSSKGGCVKGTKEGLTSTSNIHQYLDDVIFEIVANTTTTKQAWEVSHESN